MTNRKPEKLTSLEELATSNADDWYIPTLTEELAAQLAPTTINEFCREYDATSFAPALRVACLITAEPVIKEK